MNPRPYYKGMLVYLFELIASCVCCCMVRSMHTSPRRHGRVHEVMDILEELSQEEIDRICAMYSRSCC